MILQSLLARFTLLFIKRMEHKIEGSFEWKMIYTGWKKSVRDKGQPAIESPGLDWTPFLSKLFLRQEPRCRWIQNQP